MYTHAHLDMSWKIVDNHESDRQLKSLIVTKLTVSYFKIVDNHETDPPVKIVDNHETDRQLC
jgi:hypothetical protein